LTFPVAYELDALEVSRLTGAYFPDDKNYLHATGFLLDRNGTIRVAVYSSGAIGRLTAQDSLGLIEHWRRQNNSA